MTSGEAATPVRAPRPPEKSTYRLKGLIFFGPFSLAAFALGVWGFLAADPSSSCHAGSLSDAVFRATLLIARSGGSCTPSAISLPVQLIIAQALLPLLLALGTVFAAIRIVISNLRHDAQLALIHAMRGHTVICGLGETGLEAARQLVLKQGKVVAISLEAAGDAAIRCEGFGVPVIVGDATLHNTLAAAGVTHARAAIICTGSDALDLEICLSIDAMPRRAKTELLLFPEIRGGWISRALAERQTPIVRPGLQLHPFKAHDVIARTLLRRSVFVAGRAAPRLLFIGFGDLAHAILHRAILCNFALPGLRPSVLCLDKNPPDLNRPGMENWRAFADVAGAAHEFGQDETADGLALATVLNGFRPDITVITLPEDGPALRVANQLRGVLDRHACAATAIFVRVRKEARLCALLGQMVALPLCPDRISGFGDLGEVVAPEALFDEQLDALARAVHETYLANSSGDSPARVPWAALAERYRRDSRAAADHIPVKLAAAGYVLRQGAGASAQLDATAVEAMASAEHHRWSRALQVVGWHRGAERNEFRETHPLLVPWEELPEMVREENRRQISAIPDSLARAGLRILRKVPMQIGAAQALTGTDIPVFELETETETNWPETEAALRAAPGIVLLRQAEGLWPERLRTLAVQYPRAADAMTGWLPLTPR
jgi:hypothetical protein